MGIATAQVYDPTILWFQRDFDSYLSFKRRCVGKVRNGWTHFVDGLWDPSHGPRASS
jgi:hypothetical protein